MLPALMAHACERESDTPAPAAGRVLPHRLLVLLLLLSVAYFAWRSVPRALTGSMDLTVGYTAAHALLAGVNPYDPAVLNGQLSAHGAPELAQRQVMSFYRNLYGPCTLPLYLPLTLLSWPAARILWLVLNLGGVAVICRGLWRFAGMPASSNRGLGFVVFVLALAPIHSTIAMGQTAILCIAAIVWAMLLEKSGRKAWAGIAYGLAAAVKMQIGLPFIAYILWRRRWPTIATSLALLAALTALCIIMMNGADPSWYASWKSNLVETTLQGGHNDPILANPGRHSMIGLQVLLHCFTDNRQLVNWLTCGSVAAAALYAMFHIRGRYPEPDRELLALSIVGVLCLLVSYHRTYDAVSIAMPLAWAFGAGCKARPLSVALVVCGLAFIVPGQTMLHDWASAGRIPLTIADTAFWRAGIAVHQTWVLLACAGLLLWCALRTSVSAGQVSAERR